MADRPTVARTVPSLRRALATFREAGDRIALVPTMGALHRGHLALVREAHRRARRVVVSIFVNPTQFAPNEDFASYPRGFETDITALREAKADLVWAPSAAAMYPEGFATRIEPQGAAKAGLEDKFRPHFFGGVATVVAKLFTQIAPDFALFGEKDYQQLRVVTPNGEGSRSAAQGDRRADRARAGRPRAVVAQRLPLGARAGGGAGALSRAQGQRRTDQEGEPIERVLADGRGEIDHAGFALDYLEARHALTLAPIASRKDGPIRLLVAAKIGKTRLIDNFGV